MRSLPTLALLVVLSGCGESCSCGAAAIERSGSTSAAPTTPIIAWDAFKPLAPDAFDVYRATGVATGHALDDLPARARISTLKRVYAHGDSTLEIELIDTAQAPSVRALFTQLDRLNRKTELSVVHATTVQDRPALAQWNRGTGTARVGVLVADRVLVNLNVKPATSPEVALELANLFDFPALEKVIAGAQPRP